MPLFYRLDAVQKFGLLVWVGTTRDDIAGALPGQAQLQQLTTDGTWVQEDTVFLLEPVRHRAGGPHLIILLDTSQQMLTHLSGHGTGSTSMDALQERVHATLVIAVERLSDAGSIHDAELLNCPRRKSLVGVPEGKVAFTFTGQNITSDEQLRKCLDVVEGQLVSEASDAAFYNAELLIHARSPSTK